MSVKHIEKKLGKRTFTLKELAQKNFNSASNIQIQNTDLPDSGKKRICLSQIEEDLLDTTSSNESVAAQNRTKLKDKKAAQTTPNLSLTLPIELISKLIQKEISKTAYALELEEDELQAWLDLQVMAPKLTLLSLLRIAREHSLDPLKEEIALALY